MSQYSVMTTRRIDYDRVSPGRARMRMAKTTVDTPSKRAKVLDLPVPVRRSGAVPKVPLDTRAAAHLRRRYTRLYQRYLDAVQKVWTTSDKRLVTLQLGWWALDRTQAGLALVRGRKIVVCNSRFHELDRGSDRAGWMRVDPTTVDAKTRYSTLHALVAREAAA